MSKMSSLNFEIAQKRLMNYFEEMKVMDKELEELKKKYMEDNDSSSDVRVLRPFLKNIYF